MIKKTKRFRRNTLLGFLLSIVMTFTACSPVTDSPVVEEVQTETISLESIPEYSGEPYVVLNNNIPTFTEADYSVEDGYEYYSELDELGRCGVTFAKIGPETMPTEERGKIGQVKPSGWVQNKYPELIEDIYTVNRCHLQGWQLSGENSNELNLITGTRYMNLQMIPWENMIADYVKETGHHVLYRVVPVFEGDNLLASGVLMEAESVEDDAIRFNVYCYNVQPGIEFDYATGNNWEAGTKVENDETSDVVKYIVNKNTLKFHYPDCESAKDTKPQNRSEYTGTRDELINNGCEPCGRCKP